MQVGLLCITINGIMIVFFASRKESLAPFVCFVFDGNHLQSLVFSCNKISWPILQPAETIQNAEFCTPLRTTLPEANFFQVNESTMCVSRDCNRKE